jgi:hypothetical protein
MHTKTAIGSVDDPVEHEADRIADQVMRMSAPGTKTAVVPGQVRRIADPKEGEPQLHAAQPRTPEISAGNSPPIADEMLSSPGQPLDASTRAFFEPRFGYDLSSVRLHTDDHAATVARSINALAYTAGSTIGFAAGQYQPSTHRGQRLLAHELAHVMQQSGDNTLPLTIRRQGAAAPQQGTTSATAPTWTPTVNMAIKPVWDSHPSATPEQQLAIQALDINPTGEMWSGIDWPTVSVGAAQRIFKPELINQTVLGLCGPAAVLNADAVLAPGSYAQLVATVFQTGKLGGHSVNATLRGGNPPAGMDQSDWMLMSSLQDVNNVFLNYYAKYDPNDPDDVRAGHVWFQLENDLKVTGCVATTTYWCVLGGEIDAAKKASDLLRTNPADIEVIVVLSKDLLKRTKGATSQPDHAVRLIRPMEFTEVEVKFDIYTWKSIRSYTFDVPDFEKLVWQFVVGTRNPAVSL